MAKALDVEIQGRIWKLYKNKYSLRQIKKKLKEDDTIVSLGAVRNAIKRMGKIMPDAMATKQLPPETKTKFTIADTPEYLEGENTENYESHHQDRRVCIICAKTGSIDQYHELDGNNMPASKTEKGIKSFCRLLGLPLNYFLVELNISSEILCRKLCYDCRVKFQLISNVFGEIDKLEKQLNKLQTSIETDLTRVTCLEDLGDDFEIREKLRQKLNISPAVHDSLTELNNSVIEGDASSSKKQSTSTTTVSIIRNSENPDETFVEFQTVEFQNCDAIDEHIFESALASPINSNYDENIDVYDNADEGNIFVLPLEEIKEEVSDVEISTDAASIQLSSEISDHEFAVFHDHESIIATNPNSTDVNETESSAPDVRVKPCSVIVTRLDMTNLTQKTGPLTQEREDKLRAFSCELCEKSYSVLLNLTKHKKEAHGELFPFVCDICGMGLTKQIFLDRHKQLHELRAENKRYTCNTCDAGFPTTYANQTFRKEYAEHKKIHPYVRKPQTCDMCGISVKKHHHLTRHMRDHHGMPFPYYCPICNKGRHSLKQLEEHQAYHKEEKNFRCEECPREFPLQKALDKHKILCHSSHVRFQCELCSRFYKSKGNLDKHKLVHSGKRQFICDVCGMGFFEQHKLKNHSSIHTGERPHLCTECGFACRLKADLSTHMKVHEMHRKLAQDAKNAGETSKKLPVPRLAKPRNRKLRFPKIKDSLTVTDASETVTEVVVEHQPVQQL